MFEFQAFSTHIFSSRARRTAALNTITLNWGSYIAGITSRGRGGLTLYSKHNDKIQTMSGLKIRMRGHNVIVLVRFGLDAQKLKIIFCISRLGLIYRLPSSNITNPTIQLDIIIPPTGNMGNRQWANKPLRTLRGGTIQEHEFTPHAEAQGWIYNNSRTN